MSSATPIIPLSAIRRERPDPGAAGDLAPRSAGEVVQLSIEGMHCASCVSRVEQALAKVPGVASASVNLATERATVRLGQPLAVDALTRAVARAGYGARESAGALDDARERAARAAEVATLRRRLRVGAGRSTRIRRRADGQTGRRADGQREAR